MADSAFCLRIASHSVGESFGDIILAAFISDIVLCNPTESSNGFTLIIGVKILRDSRYPNHRSSTELAGITQHQE